MKRCDLKHCTGCSACYNACSFHALSMLPDEEGFLRPVINESVCRKCGRCEQVCPVTHVNRFHVGCAKKVFASWTKDKAVRKVSTSGGVFTEVAKSVLDDGGVVFGAAFDPFPRVRHIAVKGAEGLSRFRGSKYVQSEIGYAYREARRFLLAGTKVLFSGTPCQIAGLYAYLNNHFEGLLFTVDVVCHGVPTPLVFNEYVNFMEKKYQSRVSEYLFRNKDEGWYLHSTLISFENGKRLRENFFKNAYFRGFLRELFLRPSCHSCQYANLDRPADITLADFWGYRQTSLDDRDDDKGVSLVMVNSRNGQELFDAVLPRVRCFDRDLSAAVNGNQALRQPFEASPLRVMFWDDFRAKGFAYVVNKYLYPEDLSDWFKMRYSLRYRIKMRWRVWLKHVLISVFGAELCVWLKKSVYSRLRAIGHRAHVFTFEFIPLLIERMCHPMIYIFGSPGHSNLGDNAQTLCLQELFATHYPNYGIKFFSDSRLCSTNFRDLRFVKWIATKKDKIVLHSGYHFTDLYMTVEMLNRKVVQAFPDKPILAFPQTINYVDKNVEAESVRIFNAHPNLTLMCRDDVSYGLAKKIFPKCHLMLMPDIVTSMIGRYKFDNPRQGILMCMRNDKESFYDTGQRRVIVQELELLDAVDVTDTTVSDAPELIQKDLKSYLEKVWDRYSRYRLIVTDRYHGTIFSLIAGTPVIVVSSTDHKLSSGVKWFPRSFKDYVNFAHDKAEIIALARKVLASKLDYNLPKYFYETFYKNLFFEVEF